MKWIYFLFWGALFVFASCEPKDALLEHALEKAGTNRVELEKVLNRYRDTDEEKYRAACFLIRNMPFYYSYEGKELEKYLQYFKVYAAHRDKKAQDIIDSLEQADGKFTMALLNKRKDVEAVDSAFLVTHIEWAFKVRREQPWGQQISFSDFCEYILPYRIGDEPLSLWRQELYRQYNPLLDSLRTTPSATDPLQAAQVILNSLRKQKYSYTGLFPAGPHVGPDVLQWRAGSCRDLTDGLMYVCRALGIPCGTDRVIVRGDCNSAHSWSFSLDRNGNHYAADFPYRPTLKPCREYDVVKRKGKIYRTTYSLNEKWMRQGLEMPDIHPTFRAPFFHDVTAEYVNPGQTLKIPVEQLRHKPVKGEPVYLCLAEKLEWTPIYYTSSQGGEIDFGPVEGGITCVVARRDKGCIVPISAPFYVSEDCSQFHSYVPETERQTVNIYMKFHMSNYDRFHASMLKGVFEGSNSAKFEEADTLYTITRTPYRRYSTARLATGKPYRYVRYRAREKNFCQVAELSFYADMSDTVPLRGEIIGIPSRFWRNAPQGYLSAFDGNTETSFNFKGRDFGWTGMDFGKPIRVEKVVYTPANRVNFIYKGYNYELYYWGDNRWNSLGKQTATADSLVYQAPVNALLYLKCYTSGDEERIFEYKDGKQIFR